MKAFEWPLVEVIAFLGEDILTTSGIDAGNGESVGGSTEIKEPFEGGINTPGGLPLNP